MVELGLSLLWGAAGAYGLVALLAARNAAFEWYLSGRQFAVVQHPLFVPRVQAALCAVAGMRAALFTAFATMDPHPSASEALRRSLMLDVVGVAWFLLLLAVLLRLHEVVRGYLRLTHLFVVRRMRGITAGLGVLLLVTEFSVLVVAMPDEESEGRRSTLNAVRNSAFALSFAVVGGYFVVSWIALQRPSTLRGFASAVNVGSARIVRAVAVVGVTTLARGVVCLLKSILIRNGGDFVDPDATEESLVVNATYYGLGEWVPLAALVLLVRSVRFGDADDVLGARLLAEEEDGGGGDAAQRAGAAGGAEPEPPEPAEPAGAPEPDAADPEAAAAAEAACARLLRSAGAHAIPASELAVLDVLGKGGSGVVHRGRWRGTPVAVKVLGRGGAAALALEREVRVWSALRHPNVTQFLGVTVLRGRHPALVTELVERGCLFDLLRANPGTAGALPGARTHGLALDTARGLEYLHGARVLHRDVKSGNVLVDRGFRAKLCDFGLSRVTASAQGDVTETSCVFSVLWTSPEILRGEAYSSAADVYALAVVLFELLTREVPFDHLRNMVAVIYAVSVERARPLLPATLPPALAALLEQGWAEAPADRPTVGGMLALLEAARDEWAAYEPAPSGRPALLSRELSSTDLRAGRPSAISEDFGVGGVGGVGDGERASFSVDSV